MRIIGTGSALPLREVINGELAELMDTSDEWIVSRTGIESRRVLTDETLHDLARRAAENALDMAGAGPETLDMILFSTVQGEWITPGMGCALQAALGAACPAVDINGACAGFLYALDMADAYIRAGKCRRILVVCAEAMSRMVDWTDRATCVLFGDGAAAAVVEEGEGFLSFRLTARGDTEVIRMRASTGNSPFAADPAPWVGLTMRGQEVYKFAVSSSSEDIRLVAEAAGISLDSVNHFLLHQANLRIVSAVCARLNLPEERFPSNIRRTGNTSSASLPILLDELNRSGKLRNGDILVMSAFGAGLVSAACALKWTGTHNI